MKVLLAEDDKNIRQGVAEILAGEGYRVIQAGDGRTAMELFESDSPDFVCLDIMMPGLGGYDVCRRMRALSPQVPIIFISAKSEEIDKVIGLELGADDFIVKPFGVKEVVARIRAVTRRCQTAAASPEAGSFRMGDLEVFPAQLRARRGTQTIELSLRDVKILWEGYGDQCHQTELYVWDRELGNWGNGAGVVGANNYATTYAGNRDDEMVVHLQSDFERWVNG